MKKMILATLLLATTLVVYTGCKKDSSSSSQNCSTEFTTFSSDVATFPTVNFTNASTAVVGGQSVMYSWSFGDGQTSSEASPSHTYSGAGSYTVLLTTKWSKDGFATSCTDTESHVVTLVNPIVPFYAKVAGVGFTPTNSVASAVGGGLSIAGEIVSGSTATEFIGISITDYTGNTGTFIIDNTMANNITYSLGSTTHLSTSGSITVTSATSTHVKGTFSGTLDDGTVISEGVFDLDLQ